MAKDWKSQLSSFGNQEKPKEAKTSIVVGDLTISVGDILTVTQSEQVWLPHGTARKDLKVQSIDPEKRILTFENYEDPLYVKIVENGLVSLTKSSGQEQKDKIKPKEPQIGDVIKLASNHGMIQLIRDSSGKNLEAPAQETPFKLETGGEVVNIIQENDSTFLIVKTRHPDDQRLFKIIQSNRVIVL